MNQMPPDDTMPLLPTSDRGRIPAEVVAQRTVHCLDQEVLLVLTEAGICYVSLPNSCAVLGLNVRGQLQRIQRTPQIFAGLRQLSVQTRGGSQRVNCLQMECILEWLSGINSRTAIGMLEVRANAYYAIIKEAAQQLLNQSETGYGVLSLRIPSDRAGTAISPLHQEQPLQQELFEVDDGMVEDLRERRSLLEVLPGINSTDTLVTTSFQEDRAIREAGLARENDWQEEPASQRMRYIASNKLQVYLGDPEHPLNLMETVEAIRELGESTVLTARIILGLWNIQRSDQQLAKDGSAAIRISDILEWRGVQKHSRPAYSGTSKRSTDGYQWIHKQQVHRDIKLLELCHLRGYHTINIEGKFRQIRIDGPYLRVASVRDTTDKTEADLIGYFIAPGAWINTYEEHGNFFLAEIDRRIFQLHPQKDQIALRIALYLTEHWRQHLKTGGYADPITMQELLTASMVPIDHNHLTTRFAPRVETALSTLKKRGIIGEAHPLLDVDKAKAHWGKEWLHTPWSIIPPSSTAQRPLPESRKQQGDVPLSPGKAQKKQKGR
ncbi:MAG TPA: phage antirepressor N-terminal domain-containing protein [Ktedonobacteraceae bacterium]|nr:phage antirepressor N-terminal domain-containing protein [Ktedonobacteraceae bacterium]